MYQLLSIREQRKNSGMLTHQIPRELARHEILLERLAASFPDADEETLRDTLEGLSNLPEMIAAVVKVRARGQGPGEGPEGAYRRDGGSPGPI